ncbi:hypothetical protein [Acidisoma cladoniae]|uniref:hypothetical protein n=1 Tax=Acidisoma cladoniae TaxID=3040935 RepID=UPI00254E2573|nr:hypothetical protein [Acidisoma sp. PAMC 29798]
MTSADMHSASTSSGRSVWRLVLTVMLGLALASRLALGATVPMVPSAASDPIGRLQAVMVMCAPGQTKPPQAPRHHASFDDLLLVEHADNAHALMGAPAPLPRAVLAWTMVAFPQVSWSGPPRLRRAAWQARGPPSRL